MSAVLGRLLPRADILDHEACVHSEGQSMVAVQTA